MTETTKDPQTEALAALYKALKAGAKPTVRELSPADRTAYDRESKRRQRARAKEAKAAGRPEASDAAIREALADAAILLLAVDGPGADEIQRAVHKAFPGRPGVASTARIRAKTGTLRPKVLTAERLTTPSA
ncbi:hypothetical protein [Aureimonas sp. SK2]|uniref:hypothetical protein n=1 Tax=Aureimonas sp. SK2 TaxID=3015992 RepID=UPI002444A2B5|nr:hypothetical protein [Aureimonas sp. SK2]